MTRQQFAGLCAARERLRSSVDVPANLDAIAREAGMSRTHFIRRYDALFGVTPHQDRIDARLARARHLLALGDRPVTDVCFDVGFTSLGSFSALFTRRVGESPTVYRRRLRPMVVVPGTWPPALVPGCLTLMGEAFKALGRV